MAARHLMLCRDVAAYGERVLRCAWCERPIPPGDKQHAVLADSSVIDPQATTMDGWQLVIACSEEHLATIRATAPPWCDEQLWAGRLARAAEGQRAPILLAALARRAGPSADQARRAQAWRNDHDISDRTSRA